MMNEEIEALNKAAELTCAYEATAVVGEDDA